MKKQTKKPAPVRAKVIPIDGRPPCPPRPRCWVVLSMRWWLNGDGKYQWSASFDGFFQRFDLANERAIECAAEGERHVDVVEVPGSEP